MFSVCVEFIKKFLLEEGGGICQVIKAHHNEGLGLDCYLLEICMFLYNFNCRIRLIITACTITRNIVGKMNFWGGVEGGGGAITNLGGPAELGPHCLLHTLYKCL